MGSQVHATLFRPTDGRPQSNNTPIDSRSLNGLGESRRYGIQLGHARHTESRTVTSWAEAQTANSAVTTSKLVATCSQVCLLGGHINMVQVAQHWMPARSNVRCADGPIDNMDPTRGASYCASARNPWSQCKMRRKCGRSRRHFLSKSLQTSKFKAILPAVLQVRRICAPIMLDLH
jgi:hypothetical protein